MENPTPVPATNVDAAVKHYLAMKAAQKRYYEKKMDAKGPRRPRGRPPKNVAVENSSPSA